MISLTYQVQPLREQCTATWVEMSQSTRSAPIGMRRTYNATHLEERLIRLLLKQQVV